MGIVIRQSFRSSIAAYIGVVIGYLNVVILMPKYLTPEEIGLYRTILGTAALFAPIPLFGLRSAFVKFFPQKEEEQNTSLVFVGFLIFLALFSLMSGISYIMRPLLINFFLEKATLINNYLWLILVLVGLMGIHGFFESILQSKKDIATASFVRETLYRFLQSVAIILVGLAVISVHDFLLLQYYIYILITIIILVFVVRKFPLRLSYDKKKLKEANTREFFTYARYALLSGLGTVTVLQIDQIMVSKYIGLEANAIYTTAMFMAVVIEMPRKYISQITQPIITEDFKANRIEKIHQDYKKASINQLIIGSYIFLGIVINLPSIYALMPNGSIYSSGLSIVYIIGFAKLVNMVFSINGEIIVMSQHYRVNIILIAVLGLFTIFMNLIFIPKYGIEGAAFASLLTFFIFNFVKFLYIKVKFNFSPFSRWTLPCIILIVFFLFLNSLADYSSLIWLDILVRSTLLSIGYLLFIVIFKPSNELINILKGLVRMIQKQN